MNSIDIIFHAAAACLVGALSTVTFALLTAPTATVSEHGPRGYQRQQARRRALFATCEPLLRVLASWVAIFPLCGFRDQIDKFLRQSGHYMGLTANEFVAMSMLSGGAGILMALPMFPDLCLMLALATGLLPYLAASSRSREREQSITRALPGSIELIALCVSAGMDFCSALREVVGNDHGSDDFLQRELRQILRDLDLGHSRRLALLAFSERVPGDSVNDLVAALVQSEERGSPLGDVLASQAKMLHLRRSFRAEEMASKAAVKMVIPLAMLMMMILAIIIIPLLLDLKEQGF